jgi:WD40 repeat protein
LSNREQEENLPPLVALYPEVCGWQSGEKVSRVLCFCECGAWGLPEELAWMGDRCGPCHDRDATDRFEPITRTVPGAYCVAWTPEGLLAVGCALELLLVSPTPWEVRHRWRFQNVRHIAAHPKGRYLLVLHQEGTTLLDATTGEDLRTLDGPVAFHPFVERLVTFDRRARRLELTEFDGTAVQRFEESGDRAPKLGMFALAPHGRELAAVVAVGAQDQLRIWNVFTGKLKHRVALIQREYQALAWSPLGEYLLVAGRDRVEIHRRTPTPQWTSHVPGVGTFWFDESGQGATLANTHEIVTIRLDSQRIVSRLHLAGGASAISHDGMLLAQESGDRVRVLPGPAAWPGD